MKPFATDCIPLGQWPTPIHRVKAVDALWVKRDDLSGFGRGGTKVRKLESFLYECQKLRQQSIIVPVAPFSNLIHDLREAAQRIGVRVEFIEHNSRRLDRLALAELRGSDSSDIALSTNSTARLMLKYGRSYLQSLLNPTASSVVAPSLFGSAAALACFRGWLEMVNQFHEAGVPLPKHAIVSSASGATLAGFALGNAWCSARGAGAINITGVQVHPGPTKSLVRLLLMSLQSQYPELRGVQPRIPTIDNSFLPLGYGGVDAPLVELCRKARETYGFELDPIYSGKAFVRALSMSDLMPSGEVLFWHCGFTKNWEILLRGQEAHG